MNLFCPSRALQRKRRGFTVVEVMVAATLFTVLAMSATSMFIQNQRMGVMLRYRTQITNTALNILEQLRLKQYNDLTNLRNAAIAAPTVIQTTQVLIADPTYAPAVVNPLIPTGFLPVDLQLNVLDDTVLVNTWTHIAVPMETDTQAVKLDSRYWLTLKLNEVTAGTVVQTMEVVLVYQYRNPNRNTSTDWETGTVRLAVPNPDALKAGT